MPGATTFAALSRETQTAIDRFERDTGRRIADEIAERDEKMVRLFLVLHGYWPRVVRDEEVMRPRGPSLR